MIQQVSDSELELMKIIWANGGKALYAQISDGLTNNGYTWQKNTIITLLSRLVDKGLLCLSKIIKRLKHKTFSKNYMKGMQRGLSQL